METLEKEQTEAIEKTIEEHKRRKGHGRKTTGHKKVETAKARPHGAREETGRAEGKPEKEMLKTDEGEENKGSLRETMERRVRIHFELESFSVDQFIGYASGLG